MREHILAAHAVAAGQSPEVLLHPPVKQPAVRRAAAASAGNADQQRQTRAAPPEWSCCYLFAVPAFRRN